MFKLLKALVLTVVLGGIASYILVSRFAPGNTPEEKVDSTKKELGNIKAMIGAALPKAAPGGGGSGIESILGEPRQAQPGSAGVIEAMMGNDARKDDPRAKPQQEAAVKVQDGPAAPMTQPKSPGEAQTENASDTGVQGSIVREHTVAPGETLNLIAQRYFGSASAWKRIADANPNVNPDRLSIGTKLRIPVEGAQVKAAARTQTPVEASVVPAAAPAPATPEKYRIETGDTLCRIAEKFLGNANRYREIVEINPGLEPDRLFVGQEIRIPAR